MSDKDRDEVKLQTPHIVTEAAEAIKTEGQFRRRLNGQEVSGLIRGIVSELVTGNPQVEGSIPFMNVTISQGKADVKGTIRVDKPIGVTVGIGIVLINARNGSNSIGLGDLRIESRADNFVGKMALGVLNIEKKAREALANPTDALNTYLSNEMRTQGVRLEGIAMKFTLDDKFTVLLRGSRI